MDALAQELLKLGTAGIVCAVLWYALYKSEQREAKKDTRIQMLENQLTESYDERILASERLGDALHNNARAMESLVNEIRAAR